MSPDLAGPRSRAVADERTSEARALLQTTAAVDLHLDTFIPTRLFGYDFDATHAYPFRHLIGHVDLPRAARGGLKGGLWSITTNPFRSSSSRLRIFRHNVARLRALVEGSRQAAWVTTATAFAAAIDQGRHAVIPVVQGANCLGPLSSFREAGGADVVSATLVHLTSSNLGETSTPLPGKHRWGPRGLSARGHLLVESMNAEKVLIDLAHAAASTFWDVVAVHDRSQPLLVTHTGVSGVFPHWRNIDDAQLKAVAGTGGVIGVIFHPGFLGPGLGLSAVVAHLAHIVDVVGEDHAALGSDWDGFITPPAELKDVTLLPGLVAAMLQRGWSVERVKKILGENFLRCLRAVRP